MPWKSKAQAAWGHTAAGVKALGGKSAVQEWDDATTKGSLPKKVRHPGALSKATNKVKGLSETKPNKAQKTGKRWPL
jgi:hypothetical protein